MESSTKGHNYNFALQKYMLLQEQHEQLSTHLDQIRPRQASLASSASTGSSPATSPIRFCPTPAVTLSTTAAPPRKHSRSSGHPRRHSRSAHAAHRAGPDASLDTIVDEDTIYQISAEEQRLFAVNESIKRALTELLNCDAVRNDITTRMWAQSRLMETEKELRSGRRRRGSPGRE